MGIAVLELWSSTGTNKAEAMCDWRFVSGISEFVFSLSEVRVLWYGFCAVSVDEPSGWSLLSLLFVVGLVNVKPPMLPLAQVRKRFLDFLSFNPQNLYLSEFSHAFASRFLPPSCSLPRILSRPSLAPLRPIFLTSPLCIWFDESNKLSRSTQRSSLAKEEWYGAEE